MTHDSPDPPLDAGRDPDALASPAELRRSRLLVTLILLFPLAVLAVMGAVPLFVEGFIERVELVRVRPADDRAVGERSAELPVREDGGVYRPGDRIGLRFETRQPCHVYVFAVDSAGRQHVLFPDDRLGAHNPLAPGAYQLPVAAFDGSPDAVVASWLWPRAGESLMYFAYLSLEPLEAAVELAARMQHLGEGETDVPPLDPGADQRLRDARSQRILRRTQAHMELQKKLRKKPGVATRRWVLRPESAAAPDGG